MWASLHAPLCALERVITGHSASLFWLCFCAGISAGAGPTAAEIKVVEVDAYASVADLIHAAILANGGAASLKEVNP